MSPICLTEDLGTPWHLCISNKDDTVSQRQGRCSRTPFLGRQLQISPSPLSLLSFLRRALALPAIVTIPVLPLLGGGRGEAVLWSGESWSVLPQTFFQEGSNSREREFAKQTMALSQRSNFHSQPRMYEAAQEEKRNTTRMFFF